MGKVRKWTALFAVVPSVLLAAPAAVSAEPAAEPALQVIATDLVNPRGLAFSPTGTLYVAEAGNGGTGPCIPANFGPELCFGATGAITSIRNGVQRRVVSGLPSLKGPSGYGPHDIAFTPYGSMVVAIGLATGPQYRERLGEQGKLLGTLARVSPSGQVTAIGDLAAHELKNNPDGATPDSQPYGVHAGWNGYVVADAAANTVNKIDHQGNVTTIAMFPATPVAGQPFPMQAVPSSVTVGPDGAYYMSVLTGNPFPQGASKIYRMVPGQQPTEYATGFTNIVDFAFDHRGRLLVLEIAKFGLSNPDDETGALIKVERNGTRTEVASAGLRNPTGIAIGPDGAYYVSNKGIGVGEVVRIRPCP